MFDKYIYKPYFNFTRILFLLLPVSLISGPFIPDLTAVLMSFLTLLFLFYKKKTVYLFNYFILFGVIFYLYILTVSLTSSNPALSLESSLFYIRFILFAFCIRIFLEHDEDILKYLFFIFTIVIITLFFSSIYDLFNTGYDFEKEARVSGLFRDELILGSYLIRIFPIFLAIYFLNKYKNFHKNYFSLIFFILFLIMIILSGERAAIFLSILYLIFLLFYIKLNFRVILSYLIFLILSFSFFIINKEYYNRIILDTFNQFFVENKNLNFSNLNIKTEEIFFDFQKINSKKNYYKIENFDNFNNQHWFYSADFKFTDENNINGVLFMANFESDTIKASENRSGLYIQNNKVFLVNKCCKNNITLFESKQISKSLIKNDWNSITFIYNNNSGFQLVVNEDEYKNDINIKKFSNNKNSLINGKIFELTINGRTSPSSKDLLTEIVYAETKNITISYQDYKTKKNNQIRNELIKNNYNKKIINLIDETIQYNQLENYNLEKKLNFLPASHRNLLLTAYYIFKDNLLFGSGPKMFRYLCKNYEKLDNSCSTHPHNTYFQLLAETGIIGFIFVFTFFIVSLYNLYKFKKNFFKASIYMLIVLNLWPLVTTGSFFNNWLNILYFIPIGIILKDFDIREFKNGK